MGAMNREEADRDNQPILRQLVSAGWVWTGKDKDVAQKNFHNSIVVNVHRYDDESWPTFYQRIVRLNNTIAYHFYN